MLRDKVWDATRAYEKAISLVMGTRDGKRWVEQYFHTALNWLLLVPPTLSVHRCVF
jgi:hypothetical protein